MTPGDVVDVTRSAGWSAGRAPRVTVVVSTVDRAAYLPGLVAALEGQEGAPPFEVVLVDDGSTDATWPVLEHLARRTALALAALRLEGNRGAGTGRNRGVAAGSAPLLAFTDDDCLPDPGWLAALVDALRDDVVVVQGRTRPEPSPSPGPWARSLWVSAPSPWLETCNLAYRRSALEAVGGFAEGDRLLSRAGRGRGFGEDTDLGHRVLAAGGRRAFAPAAVVEHRWRPATYAQHLQERLLLRHFPELVRRLPGVRETTFGVVFLTPRTAAVDLAVVSAAAALRLRRPLLLAGALPWLRASLPVARARRGPLPLRLLQAAVADLVGLASLVEGSARSRRLVL